MIQNNPNFIIIALLSMLLLSCSKDEEPTETTGNTGSGSMIPFQELYDQGIDRYMGVFAPTSTSMPSAGVTEYFFDIPDGPVCFTGNEFSMFTRNGTSNKLLIFLQGGGFCSPNSCEAVETGIPLVPFGIMNPNDPGNAAADYHLGYVPYCDGSAMIGDNAVDSDGDGVNDRFFRGLQNLSASLDVIAAQYPAPDKIVLAGNSAGGFAVHHALPLVRLLYPEIRIDIINDSGTGIMDEGGWQMSLTYWNAESFYPESCSSCIGPDGNITDYHKYQLDQDPNVKLAYISSKQDETFAQLTNGGGPAFEAQLIEASNELKANYPEKFNYLIAEGDEHTFILSDYTYEIAGTTVQAWVGEMLNESDEWTSLID